MSFTAGSRAVVSRVPVQSPIVVTTGNHSEDQAGRNAAKRNPANYCEHRQSETAVDSSTEDESCYSGNRQSVERLVLDVFAHIPAPRRAIG